MRQIIDAHSSAQGSLWLDAETLCTILLQEFPCQLSTVVFRRDHGGNLRFDDRLAYAAEDVVFMMELAARSKGIRIDFSSFVTCGAGVNMYFSNLDWNKPKFLLIKRDILLKHYIIAAALKLSAENKALNERMKSLSRETLAFHLVRSQLQRPFQVFSTLLYLIGRYPLEAVLTPAQMVKLVALRASGRTLSVQP